jgi:hypothetical protein
MSCFSMFLEAYTKVSRQPIPVAERSTLHSFLDLCNIEIVGSIPELMYIRALSSVVLLYAGRDAAIGRSPIQRIEISARSGSESE